MGFCDPWMAHSVTNFEGTLCTYTLIVNWTFYIIFGKLNVELETLKRGERKMIDSYGEI